MYENEIKKKNKTIRFLLPSLKYYGIDFVDFFNKIKKINICLYDEIFEETDFKVYGNFFIKVNKNIIYEKFKKFLENKEYFIGCYCPDVDIFNSKTEVIIIKLPSELQINTIDLFLAGNYSKIYTNEQLEFLFKNTDKKNNINYQILSKIGSKAKNNFVYIINEEFKLNFCISDINENFEWELPPKLSEEIFNYGINKNLYKNISLTQAKNIN